MYAQNPAHKKTSHSQKRSPYKMATTKKHSPSIHKKPEVAKINGNIMKGANTYVIASNNSEKMILKSRLIGDYILTSGTFINLN